jgi:hypothetical protein
MASVNVEINIDDWSKTSRERFEEWADSKTWCITKVQGMFLNGSVEQAWEAWQEAERQMKEPTNDSN